ncbi:hypothetical protein DFH06DRAFT_1485502, partial [Mycena polygramma]
MVTAHHARAAGVLCARHSPPHPGRWAAALHIFISSCPLRPSPECAPISSLSLRTTRATQPHPLHPSRSSPPRPSRTSRTHGRLVPAPSPERATIPVNCCASSSPHHLPETSTPGRQAQPPSAVPARTHAALSRYRDRKLAHPPHPPEPRARTVNGHLTHPPRRSPPPRFGASPFLHASSPNPRHPAAHRLPQLHPSARWREKDTSSAHRSSLRSSPLPSPAPPFQEARKGHPGCWRRSTSRRHVLRASLLHASASRSPRTRRQVSSSPTRYFHLREKKKEGAYQPHSSRSTRTLEEERRLRTQRQVSHVDLHQRDGIRTLARRLCPPSGGGRERIHHRRHPPQSLARVRPHSAMRPVAPRSSA